MTHESPSINSESEESDPPRQVILSLVGLAVIWASLYLVAIAQNYTYPSAPEAPAATVEVEAK